MRTPSIPSATSCFRFDGSTNYVSMNSAVGYSWNSPYSIEFMFKTSIYPGAVDKSLWGNGNSADNNPCFNIKLSATGAVVQPKIYVFLRNDAVATLLNNVASTSSYNRDAWNHIGWTDNGGVCKLYINGVADATNFNYTPSATTLNRTSIGTLMRIAAGAIMNGYMYDACAYNRILTPAEMLARSRGLEIDQTSIALRWKGNSNGGSTVPDASGNGRVGTFTGQKYQADSPFYPTRRPIWGNIYPNGNFDVYPTSDNVPTTSTGVWVDGTASGGLTYFRPATVVAQNGTAGKCAIYFDTAIKYSGNASLKLSTTATGAFTQARLFAGASSAAMVREYCIPVKQNTSYTLTYRMKTNVTSGDSNDGASIAILEKTLYNVQTASTTIPGTAIKVTSDWTTYSATFTTNAATSVLDIYPQVTGSTGAATLIMDAWFDDILLMETSAVARSAASTRLQIRDFGTALKFGRLSTDKVDVPVSFPTDAFAVNMWVKPTCIMADSSYLLSGTGSVKIFKQGGNDMQVYGYLNAPNDFAGPRMLRFRTFTFPGTRSTSPANGFKPEWDMRTYVFYVQAGSAKCDEYVNAVKQGATHTVDYTGDTGTPNNIVTIGNGGGATSFGGIIDNVRFFSRAPTQQEITDLYYTGFSNTNVDVLSTVTLNAYKFDEGSGTNALDSSGHGRTGTITGATYTTDVPMIPRSNA